MELSAIQAFQVIAHHVFGKECVHVARRMGGPGGEHVIGRDKAERTDAEAAPSGGSAAYPSV